MNNEIMINEIMNLPKKFYSEQDIPIYALLKNTGYFENPDLITEKNIFKKLEIHPEIIDIWFNWSENKRTNSGWYIILNHNKTNKYEVGYYRNNKKVIEVEYSEINKACAYFIKREIEDIRSY
jgi:hypothetical protein